MKALFDELLRIANRRLAFTPQEFGRKIAGVEEWLKRCDSVLSEIGGDHEGDYATQLQAVKKWLKDGKALQKKLASEPDQTVAVQLAQQG
jgi:hypothetical protein